MPNRSIGSAFGSELVAAGVTDGVSWGREGWVECRSQLGQRVHLVADLAGVVSETRVAEPGPLGLSEAAITSLKTVLSAHEPTAQVWASRKITDHVSVDDVLQWTLDEINILRASLPSPLPTLGLAEVRRQVQFNSLRKGR